MSSDSLGIAVNALRLPPTLTITDTVMLTSAVMLKIAGVELVAKGSSAEMGSGKKNIGVALSTMKLSEKFPDKRVMVPPAAELEE